MSGDLEQLLAQGSLLPGGDGAAAGLFSGARAPSFNIGKLESLNLPDDVLAAAIAQMERAAGAVQQPKALLPQDMAGMRRSPAPHEGGDAGRLTPAKRKA